MNISDLEASLPNGFHDADLQSISINYARREATFSIRVWVGSEEPSPSDAGRTPIMRESVLIVRELEVLLILPPKTLSVTEGRVLDVGGYLGVPSQDVHLPPLPPDAFVYSFYVSNWDNFIVFAAHDADLRWVGAGGDGT